MAAKAAKVASKKKVTKLTKAGLINAIAESLGGDTTRKQVKAVLESLGEIGTKELQRTGEFTVPGFAKFQVRERKARPAREGLNPRTQERVTIPAKPASKVIKARPIKGLKDGVLGTTK